MVYPIACALTTANASASDRVLYEFDIRVSHNSVINSGYGGDWEQMPVGSLGKMTVLVNDDRSLFPPFIVGLEQQKYSVDAVTFDVNGIVAEGRAGSYPSNVWGTTFEITNDEDQGAFITDKIAMYPDFDRTDFGKAEFRIQESGFSSRLPRLVTSDDLPLELDTSRSQIRSLKIYHASSIAMYLNLSVEDVRVTVVPTPASVALLALSGIAATRRRR